jgi:hypothetical protein
LVFSENYLVNNTFRPLPVFVSTAFSQSNERVRGIYIDAGIGFGGISYNDEIDNLLEWADDNGLDRMTISLDLSIGWAVLQKLYVVGSLTGFGDRIYKSSDYMQLNTYLFGPGVRFYPLSSGKHLQLGADLGFGRMVLDSNISSVGTIASEGGFGVKISAAYDFDSTMTGPALLLGGEFLMDFIEGESITGFSIFAKFVYK